jgi:hypothetical protein
MPSVVCRAWERRAPGQGVVCRPSIVAGHALACPAGRAGRRQAVRAGSICCFTTPSWIGTSLDFALLLMIHICDFWTRLEGEDAVAEDCAFDSFSGLAVMRTSLLCYPIILFRSLLGWHGGLASAMLKSGGLSISCGNDSVGALRCIGWHWNCTEEPFGIVAPSTPSIEGNAPCVPATGIASP